MPLTRPRRSAHAMIVLALAALSPSLAPAAAAPAPAVLRAESFKHHVDTFNQEDNELYKNKIPNAEAWDFLKANIPLFACPDADIERTYYFRWWTYRKHIKQTPDGWVITEFLPQVSWAAKHNTISCPAGHHFYEGRWLADAKYLDDYAAFWFRKGGNPRQYSFWAADALYAYYLVKGDKALATGLLDDLVKNYEGWEQSRLTPDGLFWQIDDRDGMEVSIGKSGKRATINSYMFGDAAAIARIAELAGRKEVAAEYQRKADRLKQLVQTKLWDPAAKFFKTLPRSSYELTTPKNSQDGSVPRLHWMDSEHRGTLEWVQYTFDKPRTFDASEVYWAEGGPALGKPASWRVLVRKGGEWLPVKNRAAYGVALDTFNKVAFDPVETDAIRLEVQSAKNKSGGILEWRALGAGKNHAPDGKISKSFDIRMGRNNSVRALNDGEGAGQEAALVDVRELHGFTPWYFNLPEAGKGYEAAWKQLMEPKGFFAPFGPTTAEQRHPGFTISYEGHGCQWNGPSWPYATAVTLTALANVLHNYQQEAVGKEDYLKTLQIYAKAQRRTLDDGQAVSWIDEDLDPFTGEWIARKRCEERNAELVKKGEPDKVLRERGKDYNHSSFCDLVITGLVGLRPRADDIVEVHPLVPDGKWDFFCLDNVAYRGHTLTILWDKTGTKYGKGKGLRVFADGREIASSNGLGRVSGRLVP
ncbi:MAG: glycosyl hydrolase family 65 protein [bacterium]